MFFENCWKCGGLPFCCSHGMWKECSDCIKLINHVYFSTCINCAIKKAEKELLEKRKQDAKLFKRFLKALVDGLVQIQYIPSSQDYHRGKVCGPHYDSYIWWFGPLHMELVLEETRDTNVL